MHALRCRRSGDTVARDRTAAVGAKAKRRGTRRSIDTVVVEYRHEMFVLIAWCGGMRRHPNALARETPGLTRS